MPIIDETVSFVVSVISSSKLVTCPAGDFQDTVAWASPATAVTDRRRERRHDVGELQSLDVADGVGAVRPAAAGVHDLRGGTVEVSGHGELVTPPSMQS